MASAGAATTAEVRMEALLHLIDDLPTIPDTLLRIWHVVDDPLSTCEALADVVRFDAPLSAKLLRLANSPYYSASTQGIGDISSAISMLGFNTVKQIAVCVSVATNLIREEARERGVVDYRALWGHCVAAAVVTKRIARLTRDPNPEEAFTAALLHDLGKFALFYAMPEQYDRVLEARHLAKRPLCQMETAFLGFDHALAGHTFGETWRFPPALTEPARRHHERFVGAASDDRLDRLCLTVALGERIAHRLEPPASDLGFDPALAETGPLALRLGLLPNWLDEHVHELRADLTNAHSYTEII
jgi:HD-like signal output (HDOD) protein